MTYLEAIEMAKSETVRNPKLSNFYLMIAAGFASGDELKIIRELIANNDKEAERIASR